MSETSTTETARRILYGTPPLTGYPVQGKVTIFWADLGWKEKGSSTPKRLLCHLPFQSNENAKAFLLATYAPEVYQKRKDGKLNHRNPDMFVEVNTNDVGLGAVGVCDGEGGLLRDALAPEPDRPRPQFEIGMEDLRRFRMTLRDTVKAVVVAEALAEPIALSDLPSLGALRHLLQTLDGAIRSAESQL